MATGTAVTGAVLDRNNANAPIYILGTGTEYHTKQDHIKAKLAYDFSPTVRVAYTFGWWQNTSENRPKSYLTNAAGAPVTSGAININGLAFTGGQALTGADFVLNNESLSHTIHGLSVKSHTNSTWDWEVAASLYDYGKDTKRANAAANALPGAATGGGLAIALTTDIRISGGSAKYSNGFIKVGIAGNELGLGHHHDVG